MIDLAPKIHVAQIGVGYWGPNILRNLVSSPRCTITKVAELADERANYVKSNYPSITVTKDCNDIFNDPSINAVIISTPVKTHYQLAKQALELGKHILVEKPLVTNSTQINELAAIANKQKLVVMVGHTFLFNPAVTYLKKLVQTGDLGDVRYIYCTRLNLGRIRSDVNAFWNFAPHDISIVQHLLGDIEPKQVTYKGMSFIQDSVDDVAFVNIEYPQKILVNIHVSWLDPKRVREVVVVGSKKMVIYDDTSDNKITIYDKGIDSFAELGKNMDYDNPVVNFKYRSGDIHIPKIDSGEPLTNEINHFFDCVNGNSSCITGPEHALNVTKVLEMGAPL